MSQEDHTAASKAAIDIENDEQRPELEQSVRAPQQNDQKHSPGNSLAATEVDTKITKNENGSNANELDEHFVAGSMTSSSKSEHAKTVLSVPASKTQIDSSSQQTEGSDTKIPQDYHIDSSAKHPSSSENSPRMATAHAKKFSSLNINQRFLQNASTIAVQAAQKTAAPQPAPAPMSRLTTRRVQAQTTVRTPSPTASWASRPPSAISVNANTAKGSLHVQPSETQPAKKTGATRAPWASSTQASSQTNAKPPPIFMHDFPTAAEALDAEKKAEERAVRHAAEEASKRQAALKELERFRGIGLPAANHWDEMDDESEESLDDVVEFGDGKQYKISHEETEDATDSHMSESQKGVLPASSVPTLLGRKPLEPDANAWHHPPRFMNSESHQVPSGNRTTTATAPSNSLVEKASPRLTWGPLAQRHSILTGEPLPKAPPKSTDSKQEPADSLANEVNVEDKAKSNLATDSITSLSKESPSEVQPAKPTKTAEELAAEQQSEMMTAAERARKRREEDEQAREAERERARARAQQLEEQLKAAERAKQEALEAEKKAARERREREHAAREQEARAKLAREDMAKERAKTALLERQNADSDTKIASDAHQDTNKEAEDTKHTARRDVDVLETWRRSSRHLSTAPLRKNTSGPKAGPDILLRRGEGTGISVLPSVSTSRPNRDTKQHHALTPSATDLEDSTESEPETRSPSTAQQNPVGALDKASANHASMPALEATTTRCELGSEQAPVWRQYRVQLPRHTHSIRAATKAAKLQIMPWDSKTHTCSLDPPIGYTTLKVVNTAVDWLLPQEKAEVHLPLPEARASQSRSASLPKLDHRARQPHRNRPLDQEKLIEAIVGKSDSYRDRGLFEDISTRRYGGHSQKPTPRIRLPSVTTWRLPRLSNTSDTSSNVDESQQAYRHRNGPYTHGNGTHAPPLVSLPGPRIVNSSAATWGAGAFSSPSLGSDPHLEQVWSSAATTNPDESRNSLKNLVDEALPEPVTLHDLRDRSYDSMSNANSSIRSESLSAKSTRNPELSVSWRKLRTSGMPAESKEGIPRTSQAMSNESSSSYVLPADYTDFVLSDSW